MSPFDEVEKTSEKQYWQLFWNFMQKTLAELAEIDMVMNLKLRDDVLVTKCLGRRTCAECGGNFNLAQIQAEGSANSPAIFMPPLLPPPKCLPKMTIRADDTEEVVRTRLRLFYEEVGHFYFLFSVWGLEK